MEQTKTIQSVAQEMCDNFKRETRADGTKYYHTINDAEWQMNIIHKAHGNKLPDDSIYSTIHEVICALSDLEPEVTEDEAYEVLREIEPDAYTSDLTGWLHSNNSNVYYLEEAISMGATDGFQLLAMAQKVFIDEIANEVLQGIIKHIENEVQNEI